MKRSVVTAALAAALVATPTSAQAAPGEFHAVQLPFLWPNARLSAVAADGANSVWVGGVQGEYCITFGDYCWAYQGNPVVRHWTGSGWQEFPLKGWSGAGTIAQVTSGAGETWIEGEQHASNTRTEYLARFDGSAFQPVAKPVGGAVAAMSAGPGGAFVAMNPLPQSGQSPASVYKRTGDSWTRIGAPDGLTVLHDVRALSGTDVWAAGLRGEEWGQMQVPVLGHYDGTKWTTLPSPEISGGARFLKVAPRGADDVWALTDRGVARWDGTAWTVIAGPSTSANLTDLAVDGSGTVWVTNHDNTSNVFRYEGGAWEVASMPPGNRIDGIDAVPGTSTVWGVGGNGAAAIAVNDS